MAVEQVVVDASAGVRASLTRGWSVVTRWHLVAPTLFWSEAASGIRQLEYRREISAAEASDAIAELMAAAVEAYPSRELVVPARELAKQLGWAKTYDAEFVVLAQQLGAPLLTVDARLASTASRYVQVVPRSG